MIGRRAAARLARRYAGWSAALPAPRRPESPAGSPLPAGPPLPPLPPVVRLWFSDDTSLALSPEDPLARALQAVAAAILRPPA